MAGANHEIIFVFGRRRMFLNRDEIACEQRWGVSVGGATAVQGLLLLQSDLSKPIALLLLVILPGIVVDFESRPLVRLGRFLRRTQHLRLKVVVIVEVDLTGAE